MYIRVVDNEMLYFKDKQVILFGGGSCGLRAREEFEGVGAKVLAFCDNNRALAGTKLEGYPVIAPEQLYAYPEASIIISSTFEEEIVKQLIEMKLTNFYRIKLGVLREIQSKESFTNHLLGIQEANQFLYDSLMDKDPFFVGRLGSVELECLCHYLYFLDRGTLKKQEYPNNVKMMMNINAGFFPSEGPYLDAFSKLYQEDLKQMDLIWSMWFSVYEDKLYRDYYSEKPIADYDNTVFPIHECNPWTGALKGKKVLVIHPFETSIQRNYLMREQLFTNKKFLPNFELITMKAVQSIAGNKTSYQTWFDALQSMKDQMRKIDYDIALIGAGAYGLPLGAYAKQMGKKAVHIGGILQMFFGIKGKAWNKLGIYNEHWTSPAEEEIPMDFKMVEAGRYW